ncbi:MAG: hypothetical protein A2X08_06855 [Bacteroidetes bacterium GWA2_32_17]|nr:MAG: hypothetical protein A2X08_06855 [Bacteroidetes bacterium GWA2_32_17]
MKKSHSKRGVQYEKSQCSKRGGKHIGGSGKPDCIVEGKKIEVKNWKIPAHIGVVKKAKKSGNKIIVSKSGFSLPAKILAKKYKIKLEKGK